MTDPIADMIIRIKNAYLARKDQVVVPYSKLKHSIGEILVKKQLVESLERGKVPTTEFEQLVFKLRYVEKMPAMTKTQRISRPGRRVYVNSHKIPRVLGGYGTVIVSTNKGVMTGEEAKKLNVGGEVLCAIW